MGQKPKILQKCGIFSKIIRFERKTWRWKRLNPEIQNLLTDLKNMKNCGFYEQNTATVILQKLVNPLLTKLLVVQKFVWNMIFSSSIYLFFFFHEKCCQMNMKKCHILEDFRFLAQKRPPEKKFKKNASLYLMNFDYLSYESNLLILGHPHICDRGGALSLYTVFRP